MFDLKTTGANKRLPRAPQKLKRKLAVVTHARWLAAGVLGLEVIEGFIRIAGGGELWQRYMMIYNVDPVFGLRWLFWSSPEWKVGQ